MSDVAVRAKDALPPALQTLSLTMTVRVGTIKRTVGDLLTLKEGDLLSLRSKIDEPVEICIEDRVIALGELTESDDGEGLAVRLTALMESPA